MLRSAFLHTSDPSLSTHEGRLALAGGVLYELDSQVNRQLLTTMLVTNVKSESLDIALDNMPHVSFLDQDIDISNFKAEFRSKKKKDQIIKDFKQMEKEEKSQ